jgi:protoporphyrinogen oxidase
MNKKQVVVIGAGPAGIYSTHFLKEHGVNVLCVEAAQDVGGRAKAYVKDGYLCETGAVAMEPQWKMTRKLLDDTGKIDQFHFPDRIRMGFWRKNRWNLMGMGNLADQLQWLPDTLRFQGMPAGIIPAAIKFFRSVGKEFKNITPEHAEDNNFDDLHYLGDTTISEYARLHGGQLVDDYLAAPMIGFMMCGDSNDVCITHLIALFYDILKGMKQKSQGASFFGSMDHGLYSYFRAAYEMEKDLYMLSTPVTRVVIEQGKVKGVETKAGLIDAEHVICATTSSMALKIIPDATAVIQAMLKMVKYARTYNVMIGDRTRFTPESFLGGMFPRTNPPSMFRSMFNSGVSSKYSTPGRGDLVHCYTSYAYDEILGKMTEGERRKYLLQEVKKYFPKTPDQPELFEIVRQQEAICLDAPGQMNAVYDYEKNHLNDVQGLTLAAEYMYPIASTEGAMIGANKAVNRLIRIL